MTSLADSVLPAPDLVTHWTQKTAFSVTAPWDSHSPLMTIACSGSGLFERFGHSHIPRPLAMCTDAIQHATILRCHMCRLSEKHAWSFREICKFDLAITTTGSSGFPKDADLSVFTSVVPAQCFLGFPGTYPNTHFKSWGCTMRLRQCRRRAGAVPLHACILLAEAVSSMAWIHTCGSEANLATSHEL